MTGECMTCHAPVEITSETLRTRQCATCASPSLTLAQAEDLADRTLAAIDTREFDGLLAQTWADADRARVASDLAGLRDHAPYLLSGGRTPDDVICDFCEGAPDYPCTDAARYADGLRRTAALYGVEVTG